MKEIKKTIRIVVTQEEYIEYVKAMEKGGYMDMGSFIRENMRLVVKKINKEKNSG